jgi:uncharacterized repeat protein (TIGR03803 family)
MAITAVVVCAVAITSSAQNFTLLHSFAGSPADGADPYAGLVQGSDGSFYGTTTFGGSNDPDACSFQGHTGCGIVFKITPDGTMTTLHNFCSQANCGDGANPYGVLVQGSDGNFYGTTNLGGVPNGGGFGSGTVFKITPGGALTTLYSFCAQANCTDGAYPYAGLVQATDGNFYGTSWAGGVGNPTGGGTAFRITPAGTLTTLVSFCNLTTCANGVEPYAKLVQASDGNFYGTTITGGVNGEGTVFKMTPSGTLTTIYSFCALSNCADGHSPYDGLVQASDGNLYGTTVGGGVNGWGTVFKITTAGSLTTLYSFCSQAGCADGAFPLADLVQASDGNLYGTTTTGGSIFRITLGGQFAALHTVFGTFDSFGGLIQGSDGLLYGTFGSGGFSTYGAVFSLSIPVPSQFIAVPPCRVVDTRNQDGQFGGPPISSNGTRSFPIPQGACHIPASASAYSLNVTVVPQGPLGYLTIWPTGQTQPVVSTLNSPDGRVKANAAIVPAGMNGAVSVYVTDSTDLILDVNGYFAPAGSGGLSLYPVTPCRVLDTRNVGSGQPFQGVYNSPNGVDVLTSPCAPPATSKAFVINATVVPSPQLPYLTLWPHGQSQPNVSTLNAADGSVTSNMAIVPTNDGSIDAYAAALTQLILDISGYFAP